MHMEDSPLPARSRTSSRGSAEVVRPMLMALSRYAYLNGLRVSIAANRIELLYTVDHHLSRVL